MRETHRQQVVRFVWYRLLEAEGIEAEGVGRSCDISVGGLGMYTSRPLPQDALVFLEIATRDFNLSAVGRVRHSSPAEGDTHRVGVSFIVVPPNDRVLLKRLCEPEDYQR